jgi:hypothetical protein
MCIYVRLILDTVLCMNLYKCLYVHTHINIYVYMHIYSYTSVFLLRKEDFCLPDQAMLFLLLQVNSDYYTHHVRLSIHLSFRGEQRDFHK